MKIQSQATNSGTMSMWTVYDHPKDFPDHFVARRFMARMGKALPTPDVIKSRSLQELRNTLQMAGLTCLTRSQGDDGKIVETWL